MDDAFKGLLNEMTQPSRILFVEDDEDTADLMRRAAEGFNCELIWISQLETAKQVVRSTKFDLVFLDERLADGSGIEVFRMMVKEGIEIPVCIFSGFLSNDVLDRVRDIGAAVFMEKPKDFTADKLKYLFRTFGIKPAEVAR